MKYLDIDELAELLGQSVNTIKKKLVANPTSLPPKMHLPGASMLRWRAQEVQNWMMETDYRRSTHS